MNQYLQEMDQPIQREVFYAYAQSVFRRNNYDQLKFMIQLIMEQNHQITKDYELDDVIDKVAFGVVHEFFCSEISGSVLSVYELCRKHILYVLL